MSDTAETTVDNSNETMVKDFLNPNSMLTPGFAGGVTMMMTNTLCSFFAIPVALTGLAVAALFGSLAIGSAGSIPRRGVYYVLNTLIIFCVAMGSGNIANQIEQRSSTNQATLSIIGSAHAQTNGARSQRYIKELGDITNNPNLTNAQKLKQIKTINDRWKAEQSNNQASRQGSKGFFKSWSITK